MSAPLVNCKTCALLVLVAISPVHSQEVTKEVLAKVRACSVSVVWEGKVAGSGTVLRKGEESWVLTCKHVIHPGDWRKSLLSVAQLRPDGRVVSIQVDQVEMSEDDDIAYLRVCPALFPHAAEFCAKKPKLDTPVVHCGSLGGQHQTVTRGYVVGVDRLDSAFEGKIRDQVSLSAQGGSSGGGVFLAESGVCVGIVPSVIPPHVVFMIPTRRIVGMGGP